MTGMQGRTGRCYRCIYSWRIRRPARPRVCPRCKSRLYDTPRTRAIVKGTGLGIEEILGPHREEILRIARKYGAKNVRVFGSIRRNEATQDSDVDLLVDWTRGSNGLHMAVDLGRLLGRSVDIASPDRLWWAAEPQILREAVPL